MKTCPTCGQPMPVKRLGVIMTPFKAKIFDAIDRNGGIKPDDLYRSVFKPRSRNCMKAHIWQINEMIRPESGYHIVSIIDQLRSGRFYRLEKV